MIDFVGVIFFKQKRGVSRVIMAVCFSRYPGVLPPSAQGYH